jgi:ABC-type multidrug transport system ATPase subunit
MFLKLTKFPYVASLEIEQVKCFKEKQTLIFTDENNRPYRWTVLLGDNGTGKTTILRSILMTQKGHYYDRKSYIELLNIDEGSKIKVKYLNSENEEVDFIEFRKRDKGIEIKTTDEATGSGSYFGYGANREGAKGSINFWDNISDAANLTDEDIKLIDVERYFLDTALFKNTKKTLKSELEYEILKNVLLNILPDVEDLRIGTFGRTARLEFLTPYGWVKFTDMSLGYQTTIAWMVDLAIKMFVTSPRSKKPLEQPAVVFVDEIDLHMHPQWQQKIIQHLTEKFPKTQFIVTAHSPLIVQSATDANVIVLRRKGNQVVVENDPISVKDWRIDQILSSDLFGVSSRNLEVTQKINRRKVLLLKDRLNSVEKKELSQLQKEVGRLPTAESPEMIEAMELIIKTAKNLKR